MAERWETPKMRYNNNSITFLRICSKKDIHSFNTYSCGYGNRIVSFNRQHVSAANGLPSHPIVGQGVWAKLREATVWETVPLNMSPH